MPAPDLSIIIVSWNAQSVLLDCLRGRPTLFWRADGTEAAWQAVEPILDAQPRRGRNVFTNERGNSLTHSLRSTIDRWQKREGWRVTCHMLRHTFASHLVQKGVSLYVVGELLGHSGPEIRQIYAHLVPKELGHVVGLLRRRGVRPPGGSGEASPGG